MIKEGQGNQSNEEAEEMRERVDNLRETDSKYEDSIYVLAENEGKFREKLKKSRVAQEDIGELADIYSTKDLERIEAEKKKWIDNLTGLRNKNAYNEEVPQLLGIESRQSNDCSLLIIDFDYFKKVNDIYGHHAGDEVLKKMAEIIKQTVRAFDVAYRFGGDECVIFLPATISSRAADVAERIRSKIEESAIEIVDVRQREIKLKKTVSIGCVGTDQLKDWEQYNTDNSAAFLKDMFKAADISVINSKKNGRNRVTLYNKDLSSASE